MKKLSIIVTSYNQEKYISECLKSLLIQDISNFEIIIGDDCSTDNTPQIIKNFAENYPNIITVLPRPKNLGMQKNLQDCFNHCHGEYIAICEGDDYWIDRYKCKKMIAAFENHPDALLCFTNLLLLKDGKLEEHAKEYKKELNEIVKIHDVLFPRNLIANFSCCMYRRKILEIVPENFFESGNADWLFNMYALDNRYGLYINDVCSVYRLHNKSIWSSQNAQDSLIAIFSSCWKYNEKFSLKYSKEFYNFAKNRVITHITQLDKENKKLEKNKELEEKLDNIIDKITWINERITGILNRLEKLRTMLACITKEIKNSFLKKILYSVFHTIKKTKNGKRLKKYYILGIQILKTEKKIVCYNQKLDIRNYKYIHILHKTVITKDIVKILNQYFASDEHAFIFNSGADEKITGKLWGKNIFYGDIQTLKINMQITKKIIIYGMFSPRLVQYLYDNKQYLPIVYWAIMGGDLYSAPNDEKNNYVRKNIKAIITTFDKDEYTQRFEEKKAFDIVYNNPLTKYIKNPIKHKKNKPLKIMINNSTDVTTLEMLDILSKFKDENIIITTNLSYETFGQTNIKSQIQTKGKEIYGNKFQPILTWQPPKKYIKTLSTIDIYISNQDRQQGVGNISALMLLGKKIYIKSNVSSFKGFNRFGIKIFDTFQIEKETFNTLKDINSQDIEKNIKILKNRLSLEYQLKLWEQVFND